MDGLLLVDKPAGWSSHDVVAKVRRLLGISAVGHSGTLDPFATGLMILLLGQGTKLSQLITQKEKTYEVLLRFGIETNTLDSTGDIVSTKPDHLAWPSQAEVRTAIEGFVGDFRWKVPQFSAVKVKGRPLYQGAHKGQHQEVPEKEMSFFDLRILDISEQEARVQISCSKGSYIRSWVENIGRKLGVGATTWELRRLSTPPFSVDQALTLGQIEDLTLKGEFITGVGSAFVPMQEALPDLPSFRATPWDEKLLRNGALSKDLVARLMPLERAVHGEGRGQVAKVLTIEDGELIALIEARPSQGGFKVKRVFNKGI